MRYLLSVDKFRSPSGGADRSAGGVVDALRSEGHEVCVLQASGEAGTVEEEGLRIVCKPLPEPGWFRDSDLRTLRWNAAWEAIVQSEIREYKPERVLTQNMLVPATVAAARAVGVPATIFFRGYRCMAPDFFYQRDSLTAPRSTFWNVPWRSRLKWCWAGKCLSLYDRAYRDADQVIANSHYVAKAVERFFERPADVFCPVMDLVVPEAGQGANLDAPAAGAPTPGAPAAGAPVLFIKPQRIKGLDLFCRIAAAMPETSFVVAGSASSHARGRFKRLANVEHRGWVEDMDRLYRSASVLLAPARIPEPFGRVFVEAGLRGLPTVATDTGGIPEAVGAGGTLLSMAATLGQWVEAIQKMRESGQHSTCSASALAHSASLCAQYTRSALCSCLRGGPCD